MIYCSWSDSQISPRQNMINVRKFTRSATTSSIHEDPKSSRRTHSEPDRKAKISRSASCDLDSDKKARLDSLTGAVFGSDITETESSTQEEDDKDPSRLKKCWGKVTKVVSSQIGLLLILLGYSFIGAGIFQAIEEPHEEKLKANITIMRKNLIKTWNIAQASNNTTFAESLEHRLREYEEFLHMSFQHGVYAGRDAPRVWDYWGALFFSATVFTTIGYGHIAPSTEWGRVATMIYATIGVPLFFVVMANLGRLLTRVIKYFWSYVRKLYYTKGCRRVRHAKTIKNIKERVSGRKRTTSSSTSASRKKSTEITDTDSYVDYEVNDHFNLHPFVAITFTVLYIFAGALMYVQWEPWTYLEAFYFIFVSVSTIGFGDLVPDHPKYFLASSVYILLGLSLVAMVINVIMEFFNDTFHKAKEKVEHISRSIGQNLDNVEALRKKFPSPRSKSKKQTEDNQGPECDDVSDDDPFSEGPEPVDYFRKHHINRAFSADEADGCSHIVVDISIIKQDSEENGHVIKDTAVP